MKIHEYQSRQILSDYGIPVSKARVVSEAARAAAAFKEVAHPACMMKVQVLMGGRGKAGGVLKIRTAGEAAAFAEKFLGKPFSTAQSAGEAKTVRAILAAEEIDIAEEYYLGIVVDRGRREAVILFCAEGGVDIEEVAERRPEAIRKIYFKPDALPAPEALRAALKGSLPDETGVGAVAQIASRLAAVFAEKDASICEINPLVKTPDGRILAIDAKIVFDDNALFRHPELEKLRDPEEDDPREKKAKSVGLSYVSMEGNVGCLVNGAGLAMATMDVIKLAGGEPANFLDVGGGATADQVREGFKIILQDERVHAIFVNIFGGIMKCDVIAEGIIQASRQIKIQVPLVVRLEGTRVEEGRSLLKESGLSILSVDDLEKAAKTAVQKAGEYEKNRVHSR